MKSPNESNKLYAIYLSDPMLYDKLHMLSAEYSLSVETLANIAIKSFIKEVELIRDLRLGNVKEV